jgi:hypothetical protein
MHISVMLTLVSDTGDIALARILFIKNEAGLLVTDPGIALFFISYILIGNVLLLNVVVAVLLDGVVLYVMFNHECMHALRYLRKPSRSPSLLLPLLPPPPPGFVSWVSQSSLLMCSEKKMRLKRQ